MPLDPQVQAVLDKIRDAGNPEYWQMTPAQARDWHNRKAGLLDVKPEPVFAAHDRSVPGPASGVPVRIYVPRPATGPVPVLVWLHGGGHVVGSLDSYDALCRQLALQGDCIVASVAYRLAPEHKFLVIVGECDPLRDDGIAYARRLEAAGNLVELADYPGMVHPFFSMGGAVAAGRQAVTQAAQAVRRALGGEP
jgi:acetyl esterase/lipase